MSKEKIYTNFIDVLKDLFPKEYERRKNENCCMHCGQKLKPELWNKQ